MRKASKNTFNWGDEFDTYIDAIRKAGAPESEIIAATNTYERLRSATLITNSLAPGSDSALLISVFEELCAEAHALAPVDED